MGDRSLIEWTDATWNPVTGCTKVSTGCKHCYAERLFPRAYPGRSFGDVRLHMDRLNQPTRWRRSRRVFVNSMSDLFHEDVPSSFIVSVWQTMMMAPQHVFQVLTKRPERMARHLCHVTKPLPNVWLGVSCENQQTADERIPPLLQTPAAVRFVSAEPLLGPIELGCDDWSYLEGIGRTITGDLIGSPGIDWVIVGGESGPRARPMDLLWAESVVAQCQCAGVPVFVKQLGGWPDKRGDIEQFPKSLRVREYPTPSRHPTAAQRG